jgi:hypothetical protein
MNKPEAVMSPDSARNVCHKHESLEVSLARIERTTREGFAEISGTLKAVLADLREGAVQMAEMRVKIQLHEKVIYSAIGTALTGVLLAALALVLKGGS